MSTEFNTVNDLKDDCPIPNGTLLIIGGAEGKEKLDTEDRQQNLNMQILESLVSLTGVDSPVIEVITTAGSADPDGTYVEYRNSFMDCGAVSVGHIHHEVRSDVIFEDVQERLQLANALFFAGGDQLKLTSVYGGTEMMKFIKNRYIDDKLVVGGTSAGAMALSTPMIYGGVGKDEMIAGNVKVTTGLEFLRDVCVDTHFVDRGRFVRIAQVLAENPASIGIGIEEDTAIIVREGTHVEVIGNGVVIIIDASASNGTNITRFDGKTPITIRNLKVDILSAGETYQIKEHNPPHK